MFVLPTHELLLVVYARWTIRDELVIDSKERLIFFKLCIDIKPKIIVSKMMIGVSHEQLNQD